LKEQSNNNKTEKKRKEKERKEEEEKTNPTSNHRSRRIVCLTRSWLQGSGARPVDAENRREPLACPPTMVVARDSLPPSSDYVVRL